MTAGRQPKLKALAWAHGATSVCALGGMLGPTVFVLPDGRPACPFHIAPWWREPEAEKIGGLLGGLRGEWPCVPFGYPLPADDYPPSWPAATEQRAQVPHAHGYGSHVEWTFGETSDDAVALAVDYPADHAVRRLERLVAPDPAAAAIDFALTIHMRRASCEPVGLHGCFRLPRTAARARLRPGKFKIGRTHPSTVEPAAPIFAADRTFQALEQAPGRGGRDVDASRLPLAGRGEDLLQLDGIDGRAALEMPDESYRVEFSWNRDILPSLLLWYSNRGRSEYPWLNRHLCIGVEPVCSPFGLSPDMARAANPIAASGTPTCVALEPERPLTIRYRIGVAPI